jgi:hypothetical protein
MFCERSSMINWIADVISLAEAIRLGSSWACVYAA